MSLIFSPIVSYANEPLPITTDGTTNTQITKTASGIDQINIAAPDSSGLSHNRFTEYNANQSGQIINNFSGHNQAEIAAGSGATAVTQTQIGGLVTANANLSDSGSARVILNEVTSTNLSQILGYVEIAGSKADLIIANPNGITCSGCGFINTAHLLMVGGSSNFEGGAGLGNLGFNLKEQANPNLYVPLITIDGLGLDVTRTSSADIIASSVKLLSSVYGSDDTTLTIKTCEGRYDYAGGEISPVNNGADDNAQNNSQPVFAIDASNLAKIQSGRVFLIATKQGVGVKMAAEILASSVVNIDANGDVYYSAISAGDAMDLKSTQKIEAVESNDSFNSTISAPNLTIQAQEFKNLGKVSANNLTIQNSGALTNLGDIEALNLNLSNIANINNAGSIYGQDSLRISGGNLTNASSSSYAGVGSSGSIFSPQDYSVILTGLLTNTGVVSSEGGLSVVANGLQNNSVAIADSANLKGEISAQNNLSFVIAGAATNSGNLIAGKALNFSANSLANSAVIQSGDDSTFNLVSLVNAKNSSIYSAKNLSFDFNDSPINLGGHRLSSLTNSGEISASQNLAIVGSATITNSNKILANGALSVAGSGLTNNLNAVIASLSSSINLALTGNLQNYGKLNSKINATIVAADINNSGSIKSSAKTTITADTFTNQIDAQIDAGNDLTIGANSNLNNNGTIYGHL